MADNLEDNVNDAIKEAEKALGDMDIDVDKKQKAVSFRTLKELYPKYLAGLKRVKYNGSTNGIGGFRASVADAEYEEDDQSVDISIIDGGGMGMALMGMAAWSKFEIDEESDDGYKRTTTFDDHKALEECRDNNRRCSLTLLAYGRFIISLQGRDVEMKMLKKMVRDMDLDRLVSMAKDAAKEGS
ncbi:MAG: hypothetical protein AAF985_15895 [Bacteroidota bacterium]